jgi:uncharacterized protein (TIGR02246 family)
MEAFPALGRATLDGMVEKRARRADGERSEPDQSGHLSWHAASRLSSGKKKGAYPMKKTSLSILLAGALAAIPLLAGAADSKASGSKMAAGSVDAKTQSTIEGRMKEFAAAWNKHDPKAMAAAFAENCDLLNPFGIRARGRAEIEKLFEGEHAGVMKASTYTITSTGLQKISAGVVLGDWDCTITGMTAPDGHALPAFPHHVTLTYVSVGGDWRAVAVRAFQLLPPPGK